MKTVIIEVTVKLYLKTFLDEDDARELVENVDYQFKSDMISKTEIIADDISDRCNP